MDPASSNQLSRFPEIVDKLFNAAAQGNLSPTECSALYQDIDNEIQSLQAQPDERMRSICNDVIACFDKQGRDMQSVDRLKNWLVKHTYKDSDGNYHGAQPAFQNLLNCISKIHHSVFESDAREKSVSYLNQDPFEGQELALLEHVGGAAALELTKTNPDSVILNIGHRWFDAAKRNLNTSERMQLYADTEKAIECFYDKKMKKFVLDQFHEHPIEEWKELAKWIGENTGVEYVTRKEIIAGEGIYDLNYTGAYHIFHQLVECFSEKKGLSGNISDNLNDGANIGYIDTKALQHFEDNTVNISEIPEDVQKLVFSDVQQLQFMAMVSADFEKFSKSTLVQYINESKLTCSDLGLKNLEQIISYFGPYCKELTKLDFKYRMSEDIMSEDSTSKDSTSEDCMSEESILKAKLAVKKLSENFPKISHLDLTSFFDCLGFDDLPPIKFLKLTNCTDLESLNFLKKQRELESLDLNTSDSLDLQTLYHCPLKHLNLNKCYMIENYEFLKDLKSLETISITLIVNKKIDSLKFCPSLREIKLISRRGNTSFDFLGECQALEVLHLSHVYGLKNFDFLKNCSKLHTLKFYDDIRDSSFLFKIPLLRKLHVSYSSLAPEVIQSLQKKGIEVIMELPPEY